MNPHASNLPFGHLPEQRVIITGETLPCPKCKEPMAGLQDQIGNIGVVLLPANVRCLRCAPLPDRPKP